MPGALLEAVRPEFSVLACGAAALAVSSGANAATPSVLRAVVDAPQQDARQQLMRAVMVFAAGAVGSAARTACAESAQQRIESRLRAKVVSALFRHSKEFHDRDGHGSQQLMTIVQEDVAKASRSVTTDSVQVLRMTSSVVGGLVSALMVSGQLTAISLTMIPAVAVVALRLHKRLTKARQRLRDCSDSQAEFLAERLGAIGTLKLNGAESTSEKAFAVLQRSSANVAASVAAINGGFSGTLDLAGKVTVLTVLAVGGRLVRQGVLTGGQLLSFALHSALLGLGLSGLMRSASDLAEGRRAAARVERILAEAKTPVLQKDLLIPKACSGKVEMRNVHFAYPSRPDVAVLQGITMELVPGRVTALVGLNGAGKTTVARLIGRLYEAAEGEILLDGVDTRAIDPAWMRSHVAMVEQDVKLFRGSVRDNILLSRPDASQAEVELAAEQAAASGFIKELPDGYETCVGVGGEKLSGGQRQRVGIARALLRDPRVLLLDEATSALDSESEHAVKEALRLAAKAGRAVMVIAHRESTVRAADNVCVMENGEVVERGTFKVLANREGSRLADLMAKRVLRPADGAGSSDGGGEIPDSEGA